jgi:hypothetical protein
MTLEFAALLVGGGPSDDVFGPIDVPGHTVEYKEE